MTLSHIHLLLNHVPTIGTVVVLGLLLLGFLRRNEHLKHVGLEVLFIVSLLTMPAYISGIGAYREIRDIEGVANLVSDVVIREHQDAALWAFGALNLAGFVGWVALWQGRRRGRPSQGVVAATFVLLVLSLAIMARAANIGGEIRHPEIHGAAEAAALAERTFIVGAINQYMTNDSPWAWPAAESVHFLGMSLSLGVLLAVNLRLLGVMRRVPFQQIHRLLPWGMLGFGVNLATGMVFVVAQPGQYVESAIFYWKVGFLLVAGANFLFLTVFGRGWAPGNFTPNIGDKFVALGSIVAWFGIVYAGRMLPFLGNAF